MEAEKWYQRSYRRNLVDMHIEDWDEAFLSRFDPRAYFECMKKGHIQSPMLYIQSHVGYCNWPTKSGRMHKAFVGRETAMRDLFELCHKAGMDVVAYYSLIFNNWAYDAFPQWRMLDSSGRGSRTGGNRYGLCCPNNEGYRSFLLEQMDEYCDYFEFEGIFYDMTFWPMLCHCDSCKARWAAEVGGEIPKIVDWKDPRWVQFQKKRQEWMGEFALFITTELKKRKPLATAVHNCSNLNSSWHLGIDEGNCIASDYTGGDISGNHSVACKLFYNLSQNQPFEYMTTRCSGGLGEHTTVKSFEEMYKAVMLSYAHHGAAFLIDAIDPRGTLDERVYERIGQVFSLASGYEPYLEGEHVEDVGVYYDISLKADWDAKPFPVGSEAEGRPGQPHFLGVVGAANTLQRHHIPYGIVNSWRLELLDRLKVLILPDVPLMGAEQLDAVRLFVQKGGKLYLSGHSAPSLVKEIFGAEQSGYTEENITYLSPTEKGSALMADFTRDYPMGVPLRQAILTGPVKGEVLATVTLPYTLPEVYHKACNIVAADHEERKEPVDAAWEEVGNAHAFSSIHSNPPGKFTDYPALLSTAYGRGRVLWSAAPFEKSGGTQHGNVFAAMVRELGESFSFESDAPEYIEVILFHAPEKRRLLVSIIDVMEGAVMKDAGNFWVKVKTGRKPESVMLLPFGNEYPHSYEEGYVALQIEKLEIFKMFSIDY